MDVDIPSLYVTFLADHFQSRKLFTCGTYKGTQRNLEQDGHPAEMTCLHFKPCLSQKKLDANNRGTLQRNSMLEFLKNNSGRIFLLYIIWSKFY